MFESKRLIGLKFNIRKFKEILKVDLLKLKKIKIINKL